jgi:ABC-2 type transport system ATP-binding protein
VPGVRPASTDGDAVVLELGDEVDPQRVLDVARGAGDVAAFGPVRPSLAELFREVVS